ncbi:MAG: hypothetical protein ABIH20_03065 [Candidatus Diapherotrites archaeon]
MDLTFPCELVNWKILPAMRREIALYLIKDKEMSRKAVASKLGLTEAAICQYLKNKRGKKHEFSKTDMAKIRKLADSIIEKNNNSERKCFICKEFNAPHQIMKETRERNKK